MFKLKRDWNVDRLPTKRERRVALALSVLTSLVFGLVAFSGVMMSLDGEAKLLDYSFIFILFFGSLWVLVKSIYGKSKKPSAISIILLGVFILLTSSVLLIIGLSEPNQSTAVGFIGITGGIAIVTQGIRKRQSLNK